MTPLALRLARATSEVVGAAGTADPEEAERGVLALVRRPAGAFEDHLVWPCPLTATGLPFELSVRIGPAGAAVRCVVDVTDHRVGVAGNFPAYLEAAAEVAGATTAAQRETLWEVCARHLDGVPEGFPTRMMHGRGFGDLRRGALYFRTRWLDAGELAVRVPDLAARIGTGAFEGLERPGEAEVVGYDYTAGEPGRRKAYTWCSARSDGELEALAAAHPELAPARALAHASPAPPGPGVPAMFHQLAVSPSGDVGHRLFFFAAAWGWREAAGMGALLGHLGASFDLSSLAAVRSAFEGRGMAPALGLVAIGGETVTCYFWPVDVDRPAPSGVAPATARTRAARWLAASAWPDGDAFTTSFVGATVPLSILGDSGRAAAAALAASYEAGAGWAADGETAALALAFLARAGVAPPDAPTAVLAPHRRADGGYAGSGGGPSGVEATGPAVEALAAAGEDHAGAAAWLAAAQRPDGSWPATRWADDLVATRLAVRALAAAGGHERRVELARVRLGSMPLDRDPFRLGLWLTAWADAGGPLDHPAVAVAQAAIAAAQAPAGSWPGGPRRLTAGDRAAGWAATARAHVDRDGRLTTAVALAGLAAGSG